MGKRDKARASASKSQSRTSTASLATAAIAVGLAAWFFARQNLSATSSLPSSPSHIVVRSNADSTLIILNETRLAADASSPLVPWLAARFSDQAAADQYRFVRADGTPLRDDELVRESAELIAVPSTQHFFLPPVAVGHVRPLPHLDRPGVTLETLALRPRAFLIHDFLSPAECDELKRLAMPHMASSKAFADEESATLASAAYRSLSLGWIGPAFGSRSRPGTDTPAVRAILNRAADVARLPASLAEGVQVVRYRAPSKVGQTGEQWGYHTDWYSNAQRESGKIPGASGGGDRLVTFVLHLRDPAAGGEESLAFAGETPHDETVRRVVDGPVDCSRGLSVAPRAGTALMFYNLLPDSSAMSDPLGDAQAVHAGCPVTSGVKWAANIWFYSRAPSSMTG